MGAFLTALGAVLLFLLRVVGIAVLGDHARGHGSQRGLTAAQTFIHERGVLARGAYDRVNSIRRASGYR